MSLVPLAKAGYRVVLTMGRSGGEMSLSSGSHRALSRLKLGDFTAVL